jgi:glycosyltransferase involved in cell wall biosynthesis
MVLNTIKNCLITADKRIKHLLNRDIISLSPGKKSNKNVLLSYITFPFTVKPDHPFFFSHTNLWECQQIATTWQNHGYNVDIIDWDNPWFFPKKDYSVFIDIHANMERIAPHLMKDCKKILHITGAHWQYQNAAEQKRVSDLEMRRGIRLAPQRQVSPSRGIEYADCATILGNSFTEETFAFAKKPLYPIPISTTVQYPALEKNFNKIRKNFLWFGGTGMVHKGLDLVLEVFCQLPEYQLTVCGPVHKEPDFERAYDRELYHTKNIRTVGFTDIRSMQFLDIIKNTTALIYPSCSEGGGGSVITCMHAGLIPIVSVESSVDIEEDFGILLKNCSLDEIRDSVKSLSQKSDAELQHMSNSVWQYARANHTREKFAEEYEIFVQKNIAGND